MMLSNALTSFDIISQAIGSGSAGSVPSAPPGTILAQVEESIPLFLLLRLVLSYRVC